MHPGRSRPTEHVYRPGHQVAQPFGLGWDWSKYAMGGNLGNSQAGARGHYEPVAADPTGYHPWMADTSIQWGGGPGGYLPIDYQPQSYAYYQSGAQLAPWEGQYAKDTWTQNFDKNAPGFVNTQRGSRDPDYYNTLRG